MGLFYTPKPKPKRWQYRTGYILDGRPPEPVNKFIDDLGRDGWELIQIVDDPRIDEQGRPMKVAYFKRELPDDKSKRRLWFIRPFSGVWDED
jgi:hypothetical protein